MNFWCKIFSGSKKYADMIHFLKYFKQASTLIYKRNKKDINKGNWDNYLQIRNAFNRFESQIALLCPNEFSSIPILNVYEYTFCPHGCISTKHKFVFLEGMSHSKLKHLFVFVNESVIFMLHSKSK